MKKKPAVKQKRRLYFGGTGAETGAAADAAHRLRRLRRPQGLLRNAGRLRGHGHLHRHGHLRPGKAGSECFMF